MAKSHHPIPPKKNLSLKSVRLISNDPTNQPRSTKVARITPERLSGLIRAKIYSSLSQAGFKEKAAKSHCLKKKLMKTKIFRTLRSPQKVSKTIISS